MNRLRTLLVLVVGAVLALGLGVSTAQATPSVPAKPIATADACAVLTAEGVKKLRADVLTELGVPELASNGAVATIARDKLGCGAADPTLSGTALDAKICANLDLDGIRGLLASNGAPGIAERVTQSQLDKVAVRLNCSAVQAPVTTTPSPPPGTGSFATCADADAAGVTPIPITSSAYRIELDTDGDGVACERQEGLTGSTPNNDQVSIMPSGGVDTGDGSTR